MLIGLRQRILPRVNWSASASDSRRVSCRRAPVLFWIGIVALMSPTPIFQLDSVMATRTMVPIGNRMPYPVLVLQNSKMEDLKKMVKCINHLKVPYTSIPKNSQVLDEFNLLFANLTYCGPKAESFILSDSVFEKYQGLMLVETHFNDIKFKQFQDKLILAQWNSNGSFTPAEQGDTDTGTSGGELVATKNNIDCYPV